MRNGKHFVALVTQIRMWSQHLLVLEAPLSTLALHHHMQLALLMCSCLSIQVRRVQVLPETFVLWLGRPLPFFTTYEVHTWSQQYFHMTDPCHLWFVAQASCQKKRKPQHLYRRLCAVIMMDINILWWRVGLSTAQLSVATHL
jgi:hypothetical protein